jgi:hypothetical protein
MSRKSVTVQKVKTTGTVKVAAPPPPAKTVWTVGVSGTGSDFSTLTAALSDPRIRDGHKIIIRNGTYTSSFMTVSITKSVEIWGESRNGVIIRNTGTLFRCSAPGIVIGQMTLVQTSAGGSLGPISIGRSGVTITNCSIEYDFAGIIVSSSRFLITNCSFNKNRGTTTGSGGYHAIKIESFVDYDMQIASVITGNQFSNSLNASTLRVITGKLACGTLLVSNNTVSGQSIDFIRDFHDNSHTSNYFLDLFVINNSSTETNSFVTTDSPSRCRFIFDQNTISNSTGKGLLAAVKTSSTSFGTSTLRYGSNTRQNSGSPMAGFNTATMNPASSNGNGWIVTKSPTNASLTYNASTTIGTIPSIRGTSGYPG